jgi:hypothetical protein
MKIKDFAFYALSIITLSFFVLLPVAYGFAPEKILPGMDICKELLSSVDSYLSYRY